MMEKWKDEPDLDPEQPLAEAQARRRRAGHAKQALAGINVARAAEAKQRRAKAKEAERKHVLLVERRAAKEAAQAAAPVGAIPKPGQRAHPELVIGLAAAGVSHTRIAQALHVHPASVSHALSAAPGSRERIAMLREELKGIKITRAHAVEARLWDRLDVEVGQKGEDGKWIGGAAKDVDAVTRALLASEKIQAAAAGEAHASGAGAEPASPMDLTVLVQALLSAPS